MLGRLSDEQFEQTVSDARGAASRAFKAVVNAAAIEQERAAYRARIVHGGTVADLVALAASGYRAGAICADCPGRSTPIRRKAASAARTATTAPMTLNAIKALPVGALAADNCALLAWGVWPEHPGVLDVIASWGFQYKTAAFVWVKTTKTAEAITLAGEGLHWGMGYATRSNSEPCLLATRGAPLRLAADVHQAIIAPVGEHSVKPDEAYRRIERLYPGPYLELFARKPRKAGRRGATTSAAQYRLPGRRGAAAGVIWRARRRVGKPARR